MLKYLLMSEFLLICLTFGLASCGPDSHPKDVFNLPSPLIIRNGPPEVRLGFREFDTSSNHQLMFNDQIDISEKHPVKTIVTSRCQSNSGSSQQTREFRTDRFFLFQMLPQEVLVQDLVQFPSTCGFEISAFNDVGSSHIFNLVNVTIIEPQAAGIPIETKFLKTKEHVLRLKYKQSPEAKIHYNHRDNASLKVVCEDLSFASIIFDHIKNLADIDLRAFEINSNKSPDTSDKRPLQKCRALIIRDGMPIALSERFEVLLPRPPLALMEEFPHSIPNDNPQDFLSRQSSSTLASHWLFNTGKQTRYVRVSKRRLAGIIKTSFHIRKGFWGSHHSQRPWFKFEVQNGELIHQQKDADIFAIRPSGSIYVQTVLQPDSANECRVGLAVHNVSGTLIQAPAMPAIEEVDLEGNLLESILVSTAPELAVGDVRHFFGVGGFAMGGDSGSCP